MRDKVIGLRFKRVLLPWRAGGLWVKEMKQIAAIGGFFREGACEGR